MTPEARVKTYPPESHARSLLGRFVEAHEAVGHALTVRIEPLFNLGARIWMGKIFFDSGLTRFGDWAKQPELFEKFHPVPGLPANIAAYLTTLAEIVLPVLLVFGIFTRFPAAAMLIMAMVIEFISARTPEGIEAGISNPQHILWMFLLGYLVIRGGGPLSIDGFIKKQRE